MSAFLYPAPSDARCSQVMRIKKVWRGGLFLGGAMDKKLCKVLRARGKWTKDACLICRVQNKEKCSLKREVANGTGNN